MMHAVFSGLLRLSFIAATSLQSSLGVAQVVQLVQIRLEAEDLVGNPISSIPVGGNFQLSLFAQDLENPVPANGGVFAAAANIEFDPTPVSPSSTVVPGPGVIPFSVTPTPGLLLDVGGFFNSVTGAGDSSEQLIVSIPFQATNPGSVLFSPVFDPTPIGAVLLYFRDSPVLVDEIRFIGTTFAVVPEPSSLGLAAFGFAGLAACGWRRRKR